MTSSLLWIWNVMFVIAMSIQPCLPIVIHFGNLHPRKFACNRWILQPGCQVRHWVNNQGQLLSTWTCPTFVHNAHFKVESSKFRHVRILYYSLFFIIFQFMFIIVMLIRCLIFHDMKGDKGQYCKWGIKHESNNIHWNLKYYWNIFIGYIASLATNIWDHCRLTSIIWSSTFNWSIQMVFINKKTILSTNSNKKKKTNPPLSSLNFDLSCLNCILHPVEGAVKSNQCRISIWNWKFIKFIFYMEPWFN